MPIGEFDERSQLPHRRARIDGLRGQLRRSAETIREACGDDRSGGVCDYDVALGPSLADEYGAQNGGIPRSEIGRAHV